MSNPLMQKQFTAGAAINAFRIVSFSAAATVIQSATANAAHIGVCNEVNPASGEQLDIIMFGIAYVEAGAAVARGALVSSDSTGRGITGSAGAGVNIRTIGVALDAAAAAGDVIRVALAPGSFQG